MAYNKTNWVNENEPAINADNLNKIEAGIEDNSLQLESYGRTINEIINNKVETTAIKNEASTETDEIYSSNYLNDKLVSVGATAPTDGRRVWFKYSKNLLDQSKLRQGPYQGATSVLNRLFIDANYYLSPGTYTFFSNFDTSRYRVGVQASTNTYPNELGGNVYDSGWKTIQKFEFTISNYGYLGVSISTSNGSDNLTPSDMSDYWFMVCEGSYNQMIPYEPYIENSSINVDGEEWYSKPKVLWSGKATSVDIDLRGYSFIEVIFCSNDNFYNSLKVPVSGSTFSRDLALCNNWLTDPMVSSGHLYLKYGKAILTQSGITIKSNVEVDITNTASQIKWQSATNTLLYITTIIGYK